MHAIRSRACTLHPHACSAASLAALKHNIADPEAEGEDGEVSCRGGCIAAAPCRKPFFRESPQQQAATAAVESEQQQQQQQI
jgi:hypothetical protein